MPAPRSPASSLLTAGLGIVGFSALAGLLATVMVAPVVAIGGITANNTVGIFDSLPDYITLSQQREANEIVAKNADGSDFHIASVFDQNRQSVQLDQMSDYLKQAAISGEDRRYYQHGGVDIPSVARAALGQLTKTSGSGASTITMQLVRNIRYQEAFAEPQATKADQRQRQKDMLAAIEPDLGRKVQEMKLAIGLEKKYSKQEILAAYLNIVGMGGNTYGVEAAAEQYYSTSAADVTLPEAASLIAIVQNPNVNGLNVAKNYAANEKRRNVILEAMQLEGYITHDQLDAAIKTPVASYIKPSAPKQGCYNATPGYQSVCQFVLDRIQAGQVTPLGKSASEQEAAWKQGGLKVTVSIAPSLQDQATQILTGYAPPTETRFALGAAETTVQVGTGRILLMAQNKPFNNVGEPGDSDLSSLDLAKKPYSALNFNIDRASYPTDGSGGYQPGSSYKPYTLLNFLANGHGINEVFNASVRSFQPSKFTASCAPNGGPSFTVKNDEGESGPYTVTRATARSVNSVFMQMAEKIDQCDTAKIADSLGVHNATKNADGSTTLSTLPSCVIGGCTNNLTPLMQAAAYAAIAGGGVYCKPTLIDDITDAQGNDLGGEPKQCAQDPLITPDVANTAAYAMQTVFAGSGTANAAAPNDGTPYLGKTGTTDSSQHTWTVGSSPQASTALWVGNIVGIQALRSISVSTPGGRIQAASLRNNIFRLTSRAIDKFPGLGGGKFADPAQSLLDGAKATVPTGLVGGTVQAAQAALDAAGLTYQDGGPVDSGLPAGTVASLSPGEGSQVVQGAFVTVYTSNGLAKPVPNVVGEDEGQARSDLQSAGFTNVQEQCTQTTLGPTDPNLNKVTAQNPGGGSSANPANPVQLSVTKPHC